MCTHACGCVHDEFCNAWPSWDLRGAPGFFYSSYERKYFWFEGPDLIRKFLLVAGLALFEPGSTVQLMLAQLVCLAYLAAVLNLAPYKKESVDFTNQARLVDGVNVCANHCADESTNASQLAPTILSQSVCSLLSLVLVVFRQPMGRSW